MTLTIFLICLGAVFLAVFAWGMCQQALFRQRFPPISDAEFLARCKPGTNPGIALRVRRIVSDQLGVEYERIYPSSRFVEDLSAD